ncbi:hypothetical protein KPZU09_74820 [Klebsiella pneumoniae]|uniref:Nickel/cobalt efflux system n=1 Tax=Klebsiella pneumoniae TaxID=573 RepID=A0A919LSP5_KLEPN|nr:hypothetical protein KPZU09_74820 [Klebsiella pneumoniae]
MLHALGPGHGKIVITTWLATHPAKLKSSIGLTLAASLLQGLVAIALVVVVLALLQLPARQLHLSSFWLEKGSYLLVGALGLLLCWRALKKLRLLLRRPTFTAFTPHHVHNEHCGCGHQHLRPRSSCRPATTGGLAPRLSCRWACVPARGDHGSAVQQGNRRFWLGMAAALAMAAGTSLTITALALLVHGFRQLAIRLSRHQAPALWKQVSWATLALAGGVILLAAAGVMWLSAVPAGGGIRPF